MGVVLLVIWGQVSKFVLIYNMPDDVVQFVSVCCAQFTGFLATMGGMAGQVQMSPSERANPSLSGFRQQLFPFLVTQESRRFFQNISQEPEVILLYAPAADGRLHL